MMKKYVFVASLVMLSGCFLDCSNATKFATQRNVGHVLASLNGTMSEPSFTATQSLASEEPTTEQKVEEDRAQPQSGGEFSRFVNAVKAALERGSSQGVVDNSIPGDLGEPPAVKKVTLEDLVVKKTTGPKSPSNQGDGQGDSTVGQKLSSVVYSVANAASDAQDYVAGALNNATKNVSLGISNLAIAGINSVMPQSSAVVPKYLSPEEQLKKHAKDALDGVTTREQSRVERALSNKNNDYTPFRNALASVYKIIRPAAFKRSVSSTEKTSKQPDEVAIRAGLKEEAQKVIADDEKNESEKNSLFSNVLYKKPKTKEVAVLSSEQQQLKGGLGVARGLETERVDRIVNRIKTDSTFPDSGEPSLLLRARSKFNHIKLFRNTRVKLGLLQPTDESISLGESLFPNEGADHQAIYNRLNIAVKHAKAQSVEVQENTSAKHIGDALKGYNKDEQKRVDDALKSPPLSLEKQILHVGVAIGVKAVLGSSVQKYSEAFKKASLFRNTRMKLFGYNEADRKVSYFEALTKKRDALAVENQAKYRMRKGVDALHHEMNM